MPQLYILVRKTGTKRFIGAIPAKKGATTAKLKLAMQRLRKGFSGKIVNRTQLLSVIKKMRPRLTLKRKVKRSSKRS